MGDVCASRSTNSRKLRLTWPELQASVSPGTTTAAAEEEEQFSATWQKATSLQRGQFQEGERLYNWRPNNIDQNNSKNIWDQNN